MSAITKMLKIVPDSGGATPTAQGEGLLNTQSVLAGYEQTAVKIAMTDPQKAALRKQLTSLIEAIVMKPCNRETVIRMCNEAGVDHRGALQAMLAVLRSFHPEKPVTVADMTAATTGLGIDTRFVERDLPKLLDALSLTAQYDGKKRRFASIKELKIAASSVAKIADFGVTVGVTVAATVASQLTKSPYVTRNSSGEVVTHLRPHQTEAGKEVQRKLAEAKYLAKQELKALKYRDAAHLASSGTDPYATTGQASTWTLPVLGVAGLILAAVILGGINGQDAPAPAQNIEATIQQMGIDQGAIQQ